MPKFRLKPETIEARQLGNDYDEDCAIIRWCGGRMLGPDDGYGDNAAVLIPSSDGRHIAQFGNWIVRDVFGQFFPCSPDIFSARYEPVE